VREWDALLFVFAKLLVDVRRSIALPLANACTGLLCYKVCLLFQSLKFPKAAKLWMPSTLNLTLKLPFLEKIINLKTKGVVLVNDELLTNHSFKIESKIRRKRRNIKAKNAIPSTKIISFQTVSALRCNRFPHLILVMKDI